MAKQQKRKAMQAGPPIAAQVKTAAPAFEGHPTDDGIVDQAVKARRELRDKEAAAAETPEAKAISDAMNQVATQTIWDVGQRRVQKIFGVMRKRAQQGATDDPVVIYPPGDGERFEVAKAITSALMFERNGCINVVNDYIDNLSSGEANGDPDIINIPEPVRDLVHDLLLKVVAKLNRRGPAHRPPNWPYVSAHERKAGDLILKMRQKESGEWDGEYALAK